MFGFFKKDDDKRSDADRGMEEAQGPFGVDSAPRDGGFVTDAVGSDPKRLQEETGVAGRMLIKALDTAMGWQSSAITGYVRQLHARRPEETPEQIQKRIDDHFLALVTGSGGAAGGAAVIPGVGFVTGLGAVALESVVFLEIAAWYTLASASLRGIDIEEEERRRSLVLVTLMGSSGTALVAAAMGDQPLRKQAPEKDPAASLIARLGVPQLGGLNKMLIKQAQKRIAKSARLAVVGKLMPMGIGAVLGAGANRRLGKSLLERGRLALGPIPATWPDTFELDDEDKKKAGFSLPKIPLSLGFIGGKDEPTLHDDDGNVINEQRDSDSSDKTDSDSKPSSEA
ncbi:hypothetical protein [uncultured Corynebacterium sp.]|uniref:hypothetical protein n=1 Tax=uncultured Corynebacterium sp. TaxID=159447 RepID=UPI0025F53504|nr:hypothetical protein [uncultured Corynebacterium sp.]